jgi:surfactin synthase thioesterase subunit
MVDRWIVFGGWGIAPAILRPLFNANTAFLDSTRIAESLIGNGTLVPDWKETMADRIKPQFPGKPYGIAGWSTGAIMAWALADIMQPAAAIYLSATPSFCRIPGFPHGQHPSLLRTMRRRLAKEPAPVLDDFCEECGMSPKNCATFQNGLPISSLIAGLYFLEQATLFPLEKPDYKALFLHGSRDTIVPATAGRYFSNQVGGVFEEFDGPHAFFTDQYDTPRKHIEQFSMDCV